MAILTMMVSVTAPTLSRFFRGRTLNSEARRLLALTRSGQSRAVSEGLPMDLWVDAEQGTFGLEAEPSYETSDPKAVDFTLDGGLQLEVVSKTVVAPANTMNTMNPGSRPAPPACRASTSSMPTCRRYAFCRTGPSAKPAPRMLRLTDRDGASLWLRQSRDRVNYEISSTDK